MEKKDFYITNEELKIKTLELMAGSWNKYALATILYFTIIAILVGASVIAIMLREWYIGLIVTFISVFLFTIINYGYNCFCLETTRNTNTGIGIMFSGFKKNILGIFITFVFKIVGIAVGFVLLIVPGVYLTCRLSQVAFVMRDESKIKTFSVFKTSSKLMKFNNKRLINVFFNFLGWFILSIITFGIALIWVLPYYLMTKANFYEDLKTDF